MTVSCPSFPTGESGGSVFLERRFRFFQVRRGRLAGSRPCEGMRWAFEGIREVGGLEPGLWPPPHPILSFIQVGLVSWGLYSPCSSSNKNLRKKAPRGRIPPPRDFHINLFRLQPWLRQHLEGILNFLPL